MSADLATGQVGGPGEPSGLEGRDQAGRAEDTLGVGGAMAGMDAVALVDRVHQAFGEIVVRHGHRA
jgi:hypothetical protein